MPTYKQFEDLPVWNQAIQLAEKVYGLTQRSSFKGHYSLRDQIERAAVSVSNNIADGARQCGDGQCELHWPVAKQRANALGYPKGESDRNGFERGTTNELLAFLYIARGSAGEVRSMLHLLERLAPFKHLKSEIQNLKSVAESCSWQLRAWADSLQNSDIEGPRRLNDKSKAQWQRKRDLDQGEKEWREMLIQTLGPNHPAIPKEKI